MIAQASRSEVVKVLQARVGGNDSSSPNKDDSLIASVIRRTSDILCPCAHATLATKVQGLLWPLGTDGAVLDQKIDDLIDRLLVAGFRLTPSVQWLGLIRPNAVQST